MLNRNYVGMLLLVMLVSLGTVVGCQHTPKQLQYNADLVFTSTVESLVVYKQADMIDQETWDEYVYPTVIQGDAILDAVAEVSEESEQRTSLLMRLSRLTEKLVNIRIGAETAPANTPYKYEKPLLNFDSVEGE